MLQFNQKEIQIGIIGGGALSKALLEKIAFSRRPDGVASPILAVADPDDEAPGMKLAVELGLTTVNDYHALYDEKYGLNLLIILDSQEETLKDVISTHPPDIKIMPYSLFDLFWNALELEKQKEAMETILNGIQDFIMVTSPDMEVLSVNEAFRRTLKSADKEIIGRKCYEVFRKTRKECLKHPQKCPLEEVIRNKRHTRQIRSFTGKDGKSRHIEVFVYPIWEKSGKISQFIHISHDITSRLTEEEEINRRLKQMVEERTRQLQETHSQLLHQDKMASLGKLSASVVHEINNPIAGILNLIMLTKRVINEGAVTDKDIAQFDNYLALMETETRRISRIVGNLLAFSRQSKKEAKRIDLKKLIDITLFMNSNLLKINGIKVEKNLTQDIPDIIGAEDQLQQVFMNLVSNAAVAMETTETKRLTIAVKHSLKKNNVTVTFSDTGVGIPKEHFGRLFEPFFTTKKKGKGVGLGLSVAYGIVKDHGGCIDVASEPGKGTTFTVVLPLNPPKTGHEKRGENHA